MSVPPILVTLFSPVAYLWSLRVLTSWHAQRLVKSRCLLLSHDSEACCVDCALQEHGYDLLNMEQEIQACPIPSCK